MVRVAQEVAVTRSILDGHEQLSVRSQDTPDLPKKPKLRSPGTPPAEGRAYHSPGPSELGPAIPVIGARVTHPLQDSGQDDVVERTVWERQIVAVAAREDHDLLAVRGFLEPAPGERHSLVREVHRIDLGDVRREVVAQIAEAASDIEQNAF